MHNCMWEKSVTVTTKKYLNRSIIRNARWNYGFYKRFEIVRFAGKGKE